ncbi:ribosomal protein L22e [Lactifluus volemus]|nr:ribosomal protein L22e [Lactifluus volemus]
MPKAPASKASPAKHKFVIDYSRPASHNVFDGGLFEKFLHDHIKVDNKAGQLGDKVKVTRDKQNHSCCQHSLFEAIPEVSHKKFLKKNSLRDYLRVVASGKDSYQLSFYNIEAADDDEEE